MREKQFNAAMLEEFIDRRSGLLGISGVDGDMRRLHDAAPSNADARLAIQMFCYSVRKQVAAMIAALDGVDLLVFTGGIGENDEEVRAAICRGLSWIGVSLGEGRKGCGEQSRQRSHIALLRARAILAGGRADRAAYLGHVAKASPLIAAPDMLCGLLHRSNMLRCERRRQQSAAVFYLTAICAAVN